MSPSHYYGGGRELGNPRKAVLVIGQPYGSGEKKAAVVDKRTG